ncbi:hypothetical protein [Burkholderia diffusa]|uniref:hypothetical protein n=1 Tax=Burkholderia diffusa TaxID=488732 RepID=UPI000ACD1231|nr:hypothetical protein [Burkholderia diffusa]
MSSSTSDTSPVTFVNVRSDALKNAYDAALALRAMYEALTPFERGLAVKQIAAIKRLVDSVEML